VPCRSRGRQVVSRECSGDPLSEYLHLSLPLDWQDYSEGPYTHDPVVKPMLQPRPLCDSEAETAMPLAHPSLETGKSPMNLYSEPKLSMWLCSASGSYCPYPAFCVDMITTFDATWD
jgi:hypothetical protein